MIGLRGELSGGGCGFFHQPGVLLRHGVHLADGLRHLFNTSALFIRRRGNLPMMSFTRVTELTISVIVRAAISTNCDP